jgi:hypothetical protein
MFVLKMTTLVLIILLGIPNQIIDYKHRKKCEPGNVWGYYAKLSRGGSWEGKFMMWSGYIGIGYIVVATGYLFYALSR